MCQRKLCIAKTPRLFNSLCYLELIQGQITASEKKKMDCSKAEFLEIDEGLCVQIMHHGPFDDEPATVAIMDNYDNYIEENGYKNDFSSARLHHEIYMSDARKVPPEKWKTVIRHPICKL